MSNIRTIQDYSSNETSSFEQREWLNALREEASTRSRHGDSRIPYMENQLDSVMLERVNSNPELEDFRIGIIQNIAENRCDPNAVPFLIEQLNGEETTAVHGLVGSPVSLGNYFSIINLILVGSIGVENPYVVIQDIFSNMAEANPDVTVEINRNVEVANSDIDRNVTESEGRIDSITEENNEIRSRILNRINMGTLLRRSGILLVTTLIGYQTTPIISALLGQRLLSRVGGSGPMTTPSSHGEIANWEDVSSAFWTSWGLFFNFMSGRR